MLLSPFLSPLLARLARTPGTREPSVLERALVHGLYVGSAAMVVRPALAWAGVLPPLSPAWANWLMALAAACTVAMLWAVTQAQPRVAVWFASHLVWLAVTNAWLALGAMASLLVFVAVMFVAPAFPKLMVASYALWAAALVVGLWYGWRVLKGWGAFLRGDSMWQETWSVPAPRSFPEA